MSTEIILCLNNVYVFLSVTIVHYKLQWSREQGEKINCNISAPQTFQVIWNPKKKLSFSKVLVV